MPVSFRWPLPAVGLTVLGLVAAAFSRPGRVVLAADPPRASPTVTVYDPDPKHLWNRLHEALYVRFEGEAPDDPGELDPFLWRRGTFRDNGERYRRAVAVLDEFIAERGNRLITDPRKRALLQRDLWALFDTLEPSRWLVAPGAADTGVELASRVSKVLRRLALTADQMKALPDTYAEAVAAKKLPDWFEGSRLWDADGPWVLLGSDEKAPLARTHVEFFGGRSAFFVFLRLTAGREQTRKYLAELRSKGTAAKLPVGGTHLALVRQMELIDDRGRIVLTPVVEALEIRGWGDHKLRLNRKDFLSGRAGLTPAGPEDRERDFLALLGRNAANGRGKALGTCDRCHGNEMLSYVRPFPPSQSVRPALTASSRDEEVLRARAWKLDRYEWGLLQGLTRMPPRE